MVRRPTGGRAVWHAGELTYAVAAPSGGLGSLRNACDEIHRMLRTRCSSLGRGHRAGTGSPGGPVDAGACFSRPAGGELMVEGGKIVGSAQVRQGAAFLQHGSILLEGDQPPWRA